MSFIKNFVTVKGFIPIYFKIPVILPILPGICWENLLLMIKSSFSRGIEISQLALIAAFAIARWNCQVGCSQVQH